MTAEHGAGVRVAAPGRLHLGFLDPSGSLGRRFGSLGLVVDGFDTVIEVSPAARGAIEADAAASEVDLERIASHLAVLRERTGRTAALRVHARAGVPAHAGFGSGTQLALAVGRAFSRLHGLEIPTPTLAAWLGRGLRSGIGIAGFDRGGLLLDGGPAGDSRPAALISRLDLPAAWRIVVVLDRRSEGLSGISERQALATLPVLPRAAAADICHQVLMRVLPGAAAGEFVPFAAGLNRVQALLGDYFAPAQSGRAYTSPAVGALMAWVQATGRDGTAAVGQSSWGPTGFAIVPSAEAARTLVDDARAAGVVEAGLELQVVGARPRGASIGGLAATVASH